MNLNNIDPQLVKKMREETEDPHYLIKMDDGNSLFLRAWESQIDCETAVIIFHGITAHSKPYTLMAEPLQQKGYNVYGLDLRGHGLSDGNRGDIESNKLLLNDLTKSINYVKNELDHEKIVLLGHSLGVFTILKILTRTKIKVDGIVFLSAAIQFREERQESRSLFNKLWILINTILRPSHPVITYYREGMLGLDDPLFNFKYTLRFFKIYDIDSISELLPLKVDLPLYYAIGNEDELFTVESAKMLFEQLYSEDKRFYIMEDSKHADFADGVFDDFRKWMLNYFPV